jgi:phosphoglycolate phosphatase-like HAD superfamily hydrolase
MRRDNATGIYYNGRYSLPELKELIASSDKAIFDLCGTVIKPSYGMKILYKLGMVREEFWDTSDFHLAKHLAYTMAGNAIRNWSAKEATECLSCCGRVVRLFVQQRLGMAEEQIIRKFSEYALTRIPQSTLKTAASRIPDYARDGSLETIALLAGSGKKRKKIVFVTRAFRSNADACLEKMGIEGIVYGNEAGKGGAKILSTQDKYKIILEQIGKSREPVIVVGNNGDDLAMFKALDDSGRKGIKVAVNSEHPELLKSADVGATFRSLSRLVEDAQS